MLLPVEVSMRASIAWPSTGMPSLGNLEAYLQSHLPLDIIKTDFPTLCHRSRRIQPCKYQPQTMEFHRDPKVFQPTTSPCGTKTPALTADIVLPLSFGEGHGAPFYIPAPRAIQVLLNLVPHSTVFSQVCPNQEIISQTSHLINFYHFHTMDHHYLPHSSSDKPQS